MHLKRIKLRNFKSFSGSTEIPFQPGFTGVAGPNGMGKSNISDSILFVLGPTSSKALRADRLTHLFFNGGSSKKPATECEVALVFDNHDRLLPVDTEDVEITRYVKLAPSDPNGYYSYFYVNGRRSTQTEIDALLSHARLSGDGYNLVQQGDVNRIVGMGPVPRRGLVERLAGIAQYDEDLERAAGKRTDLDANLSRIQTLLSEIRNHLQGLEAQRLQAIQYRQLEEQKRRAESRLARASHQLAQREVESCERQLASLKADLESTRSSTQKLTDEQTELLKGLESIESEIAREGGAEGAKFKQHLDERRMAFARLDENVHTAEAELESLALQAKRLGEQIEADAAEIGGLKEKEGTLSEELAEVEARAEKTAKELADANSATDASHGRLATARKEILKTEEQQASLRQRWEGLVQRREVAKAAESTAERDLAQSEDERRTREIELKDVQLRSKDSSSEGGAARSSTDLQKDLFKQRAKEQSLRGESERLTLEVLELNRRYSALDARLKTRAERGGAAGALAAVDYLLSQRNLGKISGIRGTVQELASFDAKYSTALGVAAGSRFQALVVETDQVAQECIDLLRSEKRGRATFLPLNRMLAGRPKGKSLVSASSDGALGFALDLVKFDEELRPAFWYVFGETVVMDQLAHARSQMGGVRLVTLQGDLIEATGAMTGGFLDSSKASGGGDSMADLKRLGEEFREKSSAEAAAKAELEKVSQQVRTLAEELARRSGEAGARQKTTELLQGELKAARERLAAAEERIAELTKSKARAETARVDADSEAATLSKNIEEIGQRHDTLQRDYLGLLPATLSKRIQTLHDATQADNDERLRLGRELEGVRATLAAASKAADARAVDQKGLSKTTTQKNRLLTETRKGRDEAHAALDTLKAVEAKQSARSLALSEKKRGLEERRLSLTEGIARGQESLRSKADLARQEEIRLETARVKLTESESALKEMPEPEVEEAPATLDELRRTVTSVQAQLDALGSVNLRALEEYDAEKTRLDGFESEVNRLGQEKGELVQLVGEIENKKREKLSAVVVIVDQGFREIYSELSGGGEGEIALEDPSNPLAGGLLIKARPIGKNVQRLEQLSGGEKSLASLAFIFALQRYDPSPLYVFDEVDMSLDGVNAENVGRMLRRHAERAQFIVISLRKVTLKFAHRLFGVTMHGDGCSRVVGLHIDEIVDVDERQRSELPAPDVVPPLAAPGGPVTISAEQAVALVPPAGPVPREAAEKVVDYLVFHRSLLGESSETPELLERYLALVQNLKEGVHVVIDDPFQKATAILFELVMDEEFDPWEIDLVRFTQLFLEKVRSEGGIDFAVAGRLLYMAWNILYLQSRELLKARETPVQSTGEELATDNSFLSDMSSPAAIDVTTAVLDAPDDPPLVPMVRHTGSRPVSLLELVRAFGDAEEGARHSLKVAELRDRLREEQAAPPEVIVHGDIPERDLADAWTLALRHPIGRPFALNDLWRPTEGRDRLVAVFLALLFLVRERALDLSQATVGEGPIQITRVADARIPPKE